MKCRQTETQRQKLSTKRVFDAYATWNLNAWHPRPPVGFQHCAAGLVTQTTNFGAAFARVR